MPSAGSGMSPGGPGQSVGEGERGEREERGERREQTQRMSQCTSILVTNIYE